MVCFRIRKIFNAIQSVNFIHLKIYFLQKKNFFIPQHNPKVRQLRQSKKSIEKIINNIFFFFIKFHFQDKQRNMNETKK